MQKSAVEHLTVLRYLHARYFGSVAAVVTTDFEALYAYKRGDYQRCLQLSTQNVRMLLYARPSSGDVLIFPEFLQLLDDDIVSLSELTVIVISRSRFRRFNLMTQCQLKLCHQVILLSQTIYYVKQARKIHDADCTLEVLILKMTAQKALIATMMNSDI